MNWVRKGLQVAAAEDKLNEAWKENEHLVWLV
jgi:hypothetical protein